MAKSGYSPLWKCPFWNKFAFKSIECIEIEIFWISATSKNLVLNYFTLRLHIVQYYFPIFKGFIMMTPQLFINYKLKSVAHLPWRMMTYKALNTFIDDIFAFVIKMPTMYRLGCFRDDIVFFIFLYQRYIYRVSLTIIKFWKNDWNSKLF